ncbi:MAG: hypothetical protein AB7S53_00100 [Thiomonas sp.]|jgi:hypothetical protein
MLKYAKAFKIISSAVLLSGLVACGGGGGSSGVPLVGSGSTQAQGWVVSMAGTSTGGVSTKACAAGKNGEGILCEVGGHNDTADPGSGAIIENYGVSLEATVTNNGGPVSGATVTFSMGSSQTATSGNYCSTAAGTTGTLNCSSTGSGAFDGVTTPISYQPGLNDGTGKVTTPITATTGADGKAYAYYYPGGRSGTDVVSVVATSDAATPGGGILQAQNSATMVVN